MKAIKWGLTLLVFGISCQPAKAHVRWFSSPDAMDNTQFSLDTVSLFLIAGAVAYCTLCVTLQQLARQNRTWRHWLCAAIPSGGFEWDLLRASIAFLLIGNILTNVFIAPNLLHPRVTAEFTMVVQAALLILLVLNPALFACALLMELGLLFCMFGAENCMDYVFEFAAVAMALFISHLKIPIKSTAHQYGAQLSFEDLNNICATVIRLGVGAQLMELAIHNKFMNPGMALRFVEEHAYFNFLATLGFDSFTHLHFVLSAGLAELSFGLLLLMNLAGRFVALCVLFFFTVTSVILGLHELIGHIPIVACLLAIICRPGHHSILDIRQLPPLIFRYLPMLGRLTAARAARSGRFWSPLP